MPIDGDCSAIFTKVKLTRDQQPIFNALMAQRMRTWRGGTRQQ
jgi:hypothetical protein